MSSNTAQRKNKPKACDKGRFKLGVRFLNNLEKVHYFWSNRNQDTRSISAFRFQKLVLNKPEWIGKSPGPPSTTTANASTNSPPTTAGANLSYGRPYVVALLCDTHPIPRLNPP